MTAALGGEPQNGGTAGAGGVDPLKALDAATAKTSEPKGFVRAPKRGEQDEELTEMEVGLGVQGWAEP